MNDYLRKLRRLNFEALIRVNQQDIENYDFTQYRANNLRHPTITGYCTACEAEGISVSPFDAQFSLTNISHGAHSSDFFLASDGKSVTTQWHHEPVMFVYETPSKDYGIYDDVAYQGQNKRPSKQWYWIHSEKSPTSFPTAFKGKGEGYGDFVWSMINTFKLDNVYVTNLVKCGMNRTKDEYKPIGFFDERCVRNCYIQFLSREIELFQPRVIFAMGSKVADWMSDLLSTHDIQQLPHPASRRKSEHFKVLYFWLVLRALHNAGIVATDETRDLVEQFLLMFDRE
ncbi:MAG: hypothetical protein JSR27_09365 [Proteobacteria bacterium]|nr:hypothetical protein [Pseudomonadota bacterium]